MGIPQMRRHSCEGRHQGADILVWLVIPKVQDIGELEPVAPGDIRESCRIIDGAIRFTDRVRHNHDLAFPDAEDRLDITAGMFGNSNNTVSPSRNPRARALPQPVLEAATLHRVFWQP